MNTGNSPQRPALMEMGAQRAQRQIYDFRFTIWDLIPHSQIVNRTSEIVNRTSYKESICF